MGHVDNQKLEELDKEESEEEIEFGEQLQDDLINQFCDKLQAVCPSKLEALLAVQAVIITGSHELRKHVSGDENAAQIIYDPIRSHYVLIYYNEQFHHVEIYDSLQSFDSNGRPLLIEDIAVQITDLFGHLFERHITCLVDAEYDRQSDNFSCGYRAIGALVDLARGYRPAEWKYSPEHCLRFLKKVVAEDSMSWEMFSRSEFAYAKDDYSGRQQKEAGFEILQLSEEEKEKRDDDDAEKEQKNSGSVLEYFKNLSIIGACGWKKKNENG